MSGQNKCEHTLGTQWICCDQYAPYFIWFLFCPTLIVMLKGIRCEKQRLPYSSLDVPSLLSTGTAHLPLTRRHRKREETMTSRYVITHSPPLHFSKPTVK